MMGRTNAIRPGGPMLALGVFWAVATLVQPSTRAEQSPGDPEADRASAKPPEPKPVHLTEEALRIHRATIVIDGHSDLPWQIRLLADSSFDRMDIALPQERLQTDIPRLRQGGVGAQFWVVFVPPETARAGTASRMALEQFDVRFHQWTAGLSPVRQFQGAP